MLSLVFALLLDAQGVTVIKSLRPRVTITLEEGNAGYARDSRFEYLATSDGLYRAERLAGGAIELMPAAGTLLNDVAAAGDALYVLRGREYFGSWPEPTLLRSRDHGVTFESVSEGLLDCSLAPRYPCEYVVPHDIRFGDGRVFLEASGNLLASADEGATWSMLVGASSGRPEPMSCPLVFERIGTTMLFGTECPLDDAWIAGGTLRPDLLGWSGEWRKMETPEIENRNVQFIRHLGGGVVLASIEGGLLRSTDGGATFHWVIHYPLDNPARYPYAGHLLVSSRHPGLMLLGGFDKKDGSGYLAVSTDGGETWADSPLVGMAEVMLLAEDREGRILVGLYEGTTFTLAEAVLGERGGKRRSVRR